MSRAAVRIAAGTCAALVASGCVSDQVKDLTADPIASSVPAGGQLLTSREEDPRDGGLLGKPSPAKVLRTYAFSSEPAARGAMTGMRRQAEDAGWEITYAAPDGSGFSATRLLDGRRATLSVALNLDPAFSPAPGVFVSLTSSGG